MTATIRTDDEIMELARTIANDECTLDWHEGQDGSRAIRITGCWPETARRIGSEIEQAIFGPYDRLSGLLPAPRWVGLAQQAGWAAVWLR